MKKKIVTKRSSVSNDITNLKMTPETNDMHSLQEFVSMYISTKISNIYSKMFAAETSELLIYNSTIEASNQQTTGYL